MMTLQIQLWYCYHFYHPLLSRQYCWLCYRLLLNLMLIFLYRRCNCPLGSPFYINNKMFRFDIVRNLLLRLNMVCMCLFMNWKIHRSIACMCFLKNRSHNLLNKLGNISCSNRWNIHLSKLCIVTLWDKKHSSWSLQNSWRIIGYLSEFLD